MHHWLLHLRTYCSTVQDRTRQANYTIPASLADEMSTSMPLSTLSRLAYRKLAGRYKSTHVHSLNAVEAPSATLNGVA